MKKITEYQVVELHAMVSFSEARMDEAIEDGWQPFGSPFVQAGHAFQAVVKYADADAIADRMVACADEDEAHGLSAAGVAAHMRWFAKMLKGELPASELDGFKR